MAIGCTHAQRPFSVDLRRTGRAAVDVRYCLLVAIAGHLAMACLPARAQSANQPAYDPRQIEKRFEDQQTSQGGDARPRLPSPQFGAAAGQGDTKPLFVLRHVSITGAVAIQGERLATAYQPYVGKTISQADLSAIASAISDVYRAAGFHLSR